MNRKSGKRCSKSKYSIKISTLVPRTERKSTWYTVRRDQYRDIVSESAKSKWNSNQKFRLNSNKSDDLTNFRGLLVEWTPIYSIPELIFKSAVWSIHRDQFLMNTTVTELKNSLYYLFFSHVRGYNISSI